MKWLIRSRIPGGDDGRYEFSDTDSAVQGNSGIMIEPSGNTRFGVRYLTETDLDFKDKIDASNVSPVFDKLPKLDLGMKMPQSIRQRLSRISVFLRPMAVDSSWLASKGHRC
jgi:hypothetical protein